MRCSIANPGGRQPKEVELLTDRAKRYRANRTIPADAPKVCIYCGAAAELVDHIDGDESHGDEQNLAWACRPCNIRKANTMRNAGLGRLTCQYNPSAGARNLAQWVMAVASIRRRDKKTGRLLPPDNWKFQAMPVGDAVAMVRATPHALRVEFAQQLAAKRRPARGRATDWDIPF